MSEWHEAYMCKECGKIYDKSITNLPLYCKRCGVEMYEHYRFVDENIFGGYDHVDFELSDHVEKVVTRKRLFKREIRQ